MLQFKGKKNIQLISNIKNLLQNFFRISFLSIACEFSANVF